MTFYIYRISLLGVHIDCQYGKTEWLCRIAVFELYEVRSVLFRLDVSEEKQCDCAGYLCGDAKMLDEKHRLKVNLFGNVEENLQIGALSLFASVVICFLCVLCDVNCIHLELMKMILTSKTIENQYVGVSCGKLDQHCQVLF